LLIDGEIFFAIFSDPDELGEKVIRTIDPLQIVDIISDPDDDEEVVCYKRTDRSVPPKTRYYKDWTAEDEDFQGLTDPSTKAEITVEPDVVVYHLPFDDLGKRGNGLLSSIVSWSREHRRFMEARVALTQALSKFAWKMTAKGGQKVLNDLQAKFQSTLVNSGNALERNPPSAPGSTWAQNQGVDLQPMPRVTGAGDAKTDGDQLKLMVCAGTNIMQHYFGDPSTGNLATAEAMELPMLKSFTGYQELWKDAWRDIFGIVLGQEPENLQVNLPPMLKDDLSRLGQFLMGLHQVFPEVQVPEILQMCLVALGVNNVEDVMESIEEKKQELQAAQDALGQQLPPPIIVPGSKPQPGGPRRQKTAQPPVREAEALENLAAVIQEVLGESPVKESVGSIHFNPEINVPSVTPKAVSKGRRGTAKRLPNGEIEFQIEESLTEKHVGRAGEMNLELKETKKGRAKRLPSGEMEFQVEETNVT